MGATCFVISFPGHLLEFIQSGLIFNWPEFKVLTPLIRNPRYVENNKQKQDINHIKTCTLHLVFSVSIPKNKIEQKFWLFFKTHQFNLFETCYVLCLCKRLVSIVHVRARCRNVDLLTILWLACAMSGCIVSYQTVYQLHTVC